MKLDSSNGPKIVFRLHAIKRMFEREISRDVVVEIVQNGQTIEDYPDDFPYPSRLILGWDSRRPIHLVVADNADANEAIIVTAYEPDLALWEAGFTKRKVT